MSDRIAVMNAGGSSRSARRPRSTTGRARASSPTSSARSTSSSDLRRRWHACTSTAGRSGCRPPPATQAPGFDRGSAGKIVWPPRPRNRSMACDGRIESANFLGGRPSTASRRRRHARAGQATERWHPARGRRRRGLSWPSGIRDFGGIDMHATTTHRRSHHRPGAARGHRGAVRRPRAGRQRRPARLPRRPRRTEIAARPPTTAPTPSIPAEWRPRRDLQAGGHRACGRDHCGTARAMARGHRLCLHRRVSAIPADAGVLFPSRVLHGLVAALLPEGRLGILVPLPEQTAQADGEWQRPGVEVVVEALGPSAPGREIAEAAATGRAVARPRRHGLHELHARRQGAVQAAMAGRRILAIAAAGTCCRGAGR